MRSYVHTYTYVSRPSPDPHAEARRGKLPPLNTHIHRCALNGRIQAIGFVYVRKQRAA
jgi:hypothetical protein